MEHNQFKTGDVVVLKSGSKPMTVNTVHENNQINCAWMTEKGIIETITLYKEAVKPYKEPKFEDLL
ncbi:hypothetical protein D9M68_846420 [compost metagenome]